MTHTNTSIHRTIKGAMLAAAAAASVCAHAQYPNKPISLTVAFPPASDADLSARNLAQNASRYLNSQPIMVVNRPGASGAIGTQSVRTAAADGYTLLSARIATHAILPAMDSKTPYRWNDFTILSTLESNPYVCAVKNDGPYKSMQDLMADIRKTPGKINFSTAGVGTLQNLGPQYLFSLAGLPKDAAMGIHYKGSPELVTSLLGGQVQFVCNNLGTLLTHMQSGALRGVLTATPARLKELPSVPTARELGWPAFEKLAAWSALLGPAGLPREVTDRWADALGKLARDPEWLAGNEKLGGVPMIRSAAESERFMREQYELYDQLVTRLGIRE